MTKKTETKNQNGLSFIILWEAIIEFPDICILYIHTASILGQSKNFVLNLRTAAYGAETWLLRKVDHKNVGSCEMWC